MNKIKNKKKAKSECDVECHNIYQSYSLMKICWLMLGIQIIYIMKIKKNERNA